jgi:hypothetical protein
LVSSNSRSPRLSESSLTDSMSNESMNLHIQIRYDAESGRHCLSVARQKDFISYC